MSANVMKLPISLFQNANAAKSFKARDELRACAARIHAHGRRVIEDCLAIGKELVAAREITRGAWQGGTQEGEWRNFLAEDVKMDRHQALRFIQVYEKYGTGGPRGAPLPDTSFRVLAELAAPEADPEVVARLEEKIAKGERVTVREAAAAKKKPKKSTGDKKKAAKPGSDKEALDDLKGMWQRIEASLDRHPAALRRRFYVYVRARLGREEVDELEACIVRVRELQHQKIAKALKISTVQVWRLAKRGMPISSSSAARAWRDANIHHQR